MARVTSITTTTTMTTSKMPANARRRRRRGNAVLDMALVLPILLALAFGTVEYGYYFFVKHSMQGAAREGVRRAIVTGATASDVNAVINNAMASAGFSSSEYAISPITPANWATSDSGTTITVGITAEWGDIGVEPLPDAMGGLSTTKVISSTAVMRKE